LERVLFLHIITLASVHRDLESGPPIPYEQPEERFSISPPQNGQKSRSSVTQKSIMLAAEKLIAAKGIESVSIRDVV
jgi:hypothetical protein